MPQSTKPSLLQFRRSPFNEKARWALDLARLSYERESLLPGLHVFSLLFRTGNTLTPTLLRDGKHIVGSSRIVEDLAARGESTLLPEASRDAVSAVVARFDDDLTPRIRRAVLAALLTQVDAWHETFAADANEGAQKAYAWQLRLFASVIRLKNGMSQKGVEDGKRAIDEALAFVADTLAHKRFLIGESLTLADVTAASTLAMVVPVQHPEASYGPLALGALRELVPSHPAADWVRALYAEHRPAYARP